MTLRELFKNPKSLLNIELSTLMMNLMLFCTSILVFIILILTIFVIFKEFI